MEGERGGAGNGMAGGGGERQEEGCVCVRVCKLLLVCKHVPVLL